MRNQLFLFFGDIFLSHPSIAFSHGEDIRRDIILLISNKKKRTLLDYQC